MHGIIRIVPRPSEHQPADRPLDPEEAEALAASVQAFASGSRLRLLWALLEGEQTVEQLSERVDLSQSATSHQLRLLRQGRLVAVRRSGRHAHYRLHDHHIVDLLAALRHHHEHVSPPAAAPETAAAYRRPQTAGR